jgi:hypothetical protein
LYKALVDCKERGYWTRSNKVDVELVARINPYDFINPPCKWQELYEVEEPSLK